MRPRRTNLFVSNLGLNPLLLWYGESQAVVCGQIFFTVGGTFGREEPLPIAVCGGDLHCTMNQFQMAHSDNGQFTFEFQVMRRAISDLEPLMYTSQSPWTTRMSLYQSLSYDPPSKARFSRKIVMAVKTYPDLVQHSKIRDIQLSPISLI